MQLVEAKHRGCYKLAPPTCVLLLSKNFDPSLFFNVAPSLSMSMSNLYFFVSISPKAFISYLPPCTISILNLLYLCTISPPLSSISIKGVLLIDAKACIGVDDWGLNLTFFMDITWLLEWHHLYSFLRYHTWDLWPWHQLVGHLSLSHFMGHPFDKLELFVVRDAFFIWWSLKVEDHLWNHLLVWLISCVEMWYHAYDWFVNKNYFLNICYYHDYHV